MDKGFFITLIRVVFIIQLCIFLVEHMRKYQLVKYYNKNNAFLPCDWLVSEDAASEDRCSNRAGARQFKKNGECNRIKCKAFTPKNKDFDLLLKKNRLLNFTTFLNEVLLAVFAAIGLISSFI